MAVLPTASESPLVFACELWVFAMCPALRGSTVSYAGDAYFPKHSVEYSLNFWSQSKKKSITARNTFSPNKHFCTLVAFWHIRTHEAMGGKHLEERLSDQA